MFQPLKLDGDDVRRTLQMLKNIDPDSVKILRKELRSALKPLAQDIANEVPTNAPLSGFQHGGPTAWSPVRPGVSFRPGKRRKGGPWTPLVALEVGTKPQQFRGVYIAELAGSRTNGVTEQGKNLVRQLNQQRSMKGRGGRYIYAGFRLQRSDAQNIAERILKRFWERVDRKLR
jgi:hypothetical protein